jgi:two-component system, LytTR family, sensor kinase
VNAPFNYSKMTGFLTSKLTERYTQAIVFKNKWYHLFFWSFIIVLLSLKKAEGLSWIMHILIEIVNVGFYAIVVYTNMFLLFPKYLRDKNLTAHLLLLAALCILLTPVKTLLLFLLSHQNTEIQNLFLNNQYFIFISSFFIAVSSSIYLVLHDWWVGQKEKQELVKRTLHSELKFLRSQINPHFLFNTLNSLYALALKKSDEAPEMIIRLSEMMRYMLYECNVRLVPLEKEIQYIKNYIEFEKIRLGRKVEIKLSMEGEFEEIMITPLLLIPFVENAFKHGADHMLDNGLIDIKITVENNILNLYVMNNKIEKAIFHEKKKSGGIGLENVRKRLELLYPQNHLIELVEDDVTYKVFFSLDLK